MPNSLQSNSQSPLIPTSPYIISGHLAPRTINKEGSSIFSSLTSAADSVFSIVVRAPEDPILGGTVNGFLSKQSEAEAAEARDKICRAIQYGSKFVSNGEPGTAQNVGKSTSLAMKVFRLFKFINDLHALISPTAPGTPLPLV